MYGGSGTWPKRSSSASGSSRKIRSTGTSAVPSSRRDELRSAAGCCAISSRGRSKSKSLSVSARDAECMPLRAGRDPFQGGQNCPMALPEHHAAPAAAHKQKSAPQKALEKLGLVRDIDLALHLPLRYEDETRLTPIADLRDGDTVQIEGRVRDAQIQFRPRRQLVVRLADD